MKSTGSETTIHWETKTPLKDNLMKPLPIFATDLVDELNEMFPEQCPGIGDADRMIWFNTGKRDLVRHLLERKRLTQDMGLGTERKDGQ
jgi:hypothetical protein